MNAGSLAAAQAQLAAAASAVERPLDALELLRFAYYFALSRHEREVKATQWLEVHKPEVAAQLAQPAPEPASQPAPSNEDLVQSAIALAEQATKIQARVRGKVARGSAKEQADAGAEQRATFMWGRAIAEGRKQQLSQLRMEIEMLKRNEAILTTRLQEEVRALDDERRRLAVENEQLRRAAAEAATAGPPPPPPQSAEERLAALNWLVRAKTRPATADDERLAGAASPAALGGTL